MRRTSRTQEKNQPRKVLGLPNPPARLARQQRLHRLLKPKRRHSRRKHARTHAVDRDVLRHQLRGLHLREVDARRLRGPVAEGAGAGRGQAAVVADSHVGGLDAGHGGDVDDA